jgi:RalA-binding protein 1
VNKLPRANRELLDILSTFLREIVDKEGINKMSVRNGKSLNSRVVVK